MSSGGRRFYQSDPLIKYLIAPLTVNSPGQTLTNALDLSYSAFETNLPYCSISNINTSGGITTLIAGSSTYFITGATLNAGQLYLDTGRRVTLFGENITTGGYNKTAIYTQIIPMNGQTTEGITFVDTNLYAKVWAANGQNVYVSRIG